MKTLLTCVLVMGLGLTCVVASAQLLNCTVDHSKDDDLSACPYSHKEMSYIFERSDGGGWPTYDLKDGCETFIIQDALDSYAVCVVENEKKYALELGDDDTPRLREVKECPCK